MFTDAKKSDLPTLGSCVWQPITEERTPGGVTSSPHSPNICLSAWQSREAGRQRSREAEDRVVKKNNTRSRRFAQPRWPSRTIILSLQAANDRRCFGGRSNLHAIMMNVASIPLAISCLYHFHKHRDGSFTIRLQCFCQKSMHLH